MPYKVLIKMDLVCEREWERNTLDRAKALADRLATFGIRADIGQRAPQAVKADLEEAVYESLEVRVFITHPNGEEVEIEP